MTLAELRKIAEAATSEGWEWINHESERPDLGAKYPQVRGLSNQSLLAFDYNIEGNKPDFEFVETFSPTTVLALLSRLEAAEDALRFYGDESNYEAMQVDDNDFNGNPTTVEVKTCLWSEQSDCEEIPYDEKSLGSSCYYLAGKRAREYFAKFEGDG